MFLNGFLKEGLRLFHISVVWTIVAYIYIYVDCSYVKMFLWREHCYYLHFSSIYMAFVLITAQGNGIVTLICQLPCKCLLRVGKD